MRVTFATLIAILAATTTANAAVAGPLEEARLGVMAHNICLLDCKNSGKEDGVNINGELVFASPSFLTWAWSPRPYVMGSINTAGETSYGGAGLEWEFPITRGWSFEPGVGYVIHNGELDNPFAPGDPQRATFQDENLLLGSEDLFRLSLGINRELSNNWGVQFLYEHLSHGQILGDGRNQGLDEVGVRLTYDFND